MRLLCGSAVSQYGNPGERERVEFAAPFVELAVNHVIQGFFFGIFRCRAAVKYSKVKYGESRWYFLMGMLCISLKVKVTSDVSR